MRLLTIRVLAITLFSLGFAPVAPALTATWTNTVSTQYWTNDANWNPTTYPGTLDGENAFLTNNAGTYTNILNYSTGNTITTLAISNRTGEAWLILTNAVLNNTTLTVGANGKLQIDNNGVLTNFTSLIFRGTNGLLAVNSGGKLFGGSVMIGTNSAFNRMTVTNATIQTTGAVTIGQANGAFGNSLSVQANSSWDLGNANLLISLQNANAATVMTGQSVLVDGGGIAGGAVLTNINALQIARAPNSGVTNLFNSLTITNGGRVFATSGKVGYADNVVGNSAQSKSNTITVVGPGSLLSFSDALFVGESGSSGTASGNRLTITDNAILLAGGVTVGRAAGGSENFLYLENGGQLTNTGAFIVGATGGRDNRAYIGGEGAPVYATNGAVTVGANSTTGISRDNALIITNATFVSSTTVIGQGGGNGINTTINNEAQILRGATWNVLGANFSVGLTAGTQQIISNNVTRVDGGGVAGGAVLTNVGALTVGTTGNSNATNIFNSVIITNGGRVFSSSGIIGQTATAANPGRSDGNAVIVTGANSEWTVSSGIVIGTSNAGNRQSVGNQLLISDGAIVTAGTITVGSGNAAASNNFVLVTNGGLLEANALSNFTGSTGNTISNVAGIYQFTTNTPVLKPGPGTIALTDGTISFRAITNADVKANWSGTLTNIAFAGANTFRLNAASNTTAATQNYTFNTGLGATNYTRLEMINGHTAYRGGDITIGTSGTMLLSNTTATITGSFTNTGSLSFVNARATYQSRVYNSGTNTMLNSIGTFNTGVINAGRWATDPTTNVFQGFGLTNTISGIITMAAGDVYIFSNTDASTSANFVNVSTNKAASDMNSGKFLFSGGLSLTQTFYAAGLDHGPVAATATSVVTATSGYPGFTANFSLGTLEISNFSTVRVSDAFSLLGPGVNDGLLAGLYLENLFLGANSLLIIDQNVQLYFKNSNSWGSANFLLEGNPTFDNSLSGLHQITIIPEPSVLLLVMGGLMTIYFGRRRRARLARG